MCNVCGTTQLTTDHIPPPPKITIIVPTLVVQNAPEDVTVQCVWLAGETPVLEGQTLFDEPRVSTVHFDWMLFSQNMLCGRKWRESVPGSPGQNNCVEAWGGFWSYKQNGNENA